MQDDALAHIGDMLRVADPADADAVREADTRAYTMALIAAGFFRARVGEGQALRLLVEALTSSRPIDDTSPSDVPASRQAEALLASLRVHRADDPCQARNAHNEAAAMILAGATFLQERHGDAQMSGVLGHISGLLQQVAASGERPLSAPATPSPVLPPPADTPDFTSRHRSEVGLAKRINIMSDFLRHAPQPDAQSDALASIMASATFLRERFGERYSVEALRQVETTVSQAAALDRWQPDRSRPN